MLYKNCRYQAVSYPIPFLDCFDVNVNICFNKDTRSIISTTSNYQRHYDTLLIQI